MEVIRKINVGIAEAVCADVPAQLVTVGLGSCVGVTMLDMRNRIGGLVHIMLPSSEGFSKENLNPAKYADTAIPYLLKMMVDAGAEKKSISAGMVGGASMFRTAGDVSLSDIGARNIQAVTETLEQHQLHLTANFTGGNRARSICLDLGEQLVKVRESGGEWQVI